MGSSPADKKTAQSSSAGSQALDQQQAANAQKNQQFADQTRQSLFGTYNPATGQYSGGSESAFLDPNSLDQNGLSGTYLDQYNNAANQGAQTARQGVSTAMQSAANQGMGRMPSGFEADQIRQAYNQQAANQGNLYAAAANQQHQDALTNYWNATNQLNANAGQTADLSQSGNEAAANNYASLYGTAMNQKPSVGASLLGAATGLAGAGATAYAGR